MAGIDPARDPRGARWEARLRVPVVVAAVLAIPAVVLYLLAKEGPLAIAAVVLSWAVWLVFAVEAVIMLRVVADRKAWARGHWLGLVIVVGSFPLLVEIAKGLLAARAVNSALAVRALQGLYLVKLAKVGKSVWVLHQQLDGRARVAVGGAALAAVPAGGLILTRAF